MKHTVPPGSAPLTPDLQDLPSVACFFDWYWFPRRVFDQTLSSGEVGAAWTGYVAEAERLCRLLQEGEGLADRYDVTEEAGG
jgi:hypothetical protein